MSSEMENERTSSGRWEVLTARNDDVDRLDVGGQLRIQTHADVILEEEPRCDMRPEITSLIQAVRYPGRGREDETNGEKRGHVSMIYTMMRVSACTIRQSSDSRSLAK